MLHWKQWTQLQLFDVATCLVLLAGVPLLIQRYIYWNCFFSFVVSGKTKFHPTCVYSPHLCIQNAQNETRKSKMPPKWKILLPLASHLAENLPKATHTHNRVQTT